MENAKNPLIRSFGRTHGKKLSARQQWLVDNLLPSLIPGDFEQKTILEIGFGAGEHLMQLALENPNSTIIGAEPFINGISSLLSHITDDKNQVKPEFKNIRIWPDDVRKLITDTKIHNLDTVYILHPDPWPKSRHEKRRLLTSDFLKTIQSLISKDGTIIIGTDHTDYYNWILEQLKLTDLKIKTKTAEVIKTRYQQKNMFGSDKTMYLILGN